ncbi:hypothetical protein PROFUN_06583 [Planoprotostelium fungivorum]|uniref:Endoplasmic reticulum transmembrane protein n=1 Tax=Planoprotostelium fungivorum TaxID=1890364 RepID=A0A2P6MRX1_9EUKA|nr:hypothetical protein PROFUN_06583 [Planoprotostelium fungivorum]
MVEAIFLVVLLFPYVPDNLVENLLQVLTLKATRIVFVILALFTGDQTYKMYKEERRVIDKLTHAEIEHHRGQKFRSERNFYLCAFTLTLFLIIMRMSSLLKSHIAERRELAEFRKRSTSAKAQ